jgi:sugar lactone lactonase YvrE
MHALRAQSAKGNTLRIGLPAQAGMSLAKFFASVVLACALAGSVVRAAEVSTHYFHPGDVWFVDHVYGLLARLDYADGQVYWHGCNFVFPIDLAISPLDDRIYLVEEGNVATGTPSVLYRFHMATEEILMIASDTPHAFTSVCVHHDGDVFVAKPKARQLLRFNPKTLEPQTIPVPWEPYNLTASGDGTLYIIAWQVPGDPVTAHIFRFDPDTGVATVMSKGQHFVQPDGSAIGSDGYLYVADDGANWPYGGAVLRINRATGLQTFFARGGHIGACFDVGFQEEGGLYIADGGGNMPHGGGLISLDPVSRRDLVLFAPDWPWIPAGGPAPLALAVVPPIANLVALEVNQSVQNWYNEVRLISGKKTIVRAFVEPINKEELRFEARLEGKRFGIELPGSPIAALNQSIQAHKYDPNQRTNLDWSLNFQLPPDWITEGPLSLRLVWDTGFLDVRDAATVGLTDPEGAVHVTFTNGALPNVTFALLSWSNSSGYISAPSLPDVEVIRDRLKAMYPIHDLNYAWFVKGLGKAHKDWDGTNWWQWWQLPWSTNFISDIIASLECSAALSELLGQKKLIFGVFASGTEFYRGQAHAIPSRAAVGQVSGDLFDVFATVPPHELGHVLGRHHAVNYLVTTNTSLGLDTFSNVADYIGEMESDVMDALTNGYHLGPCGEYGGPEAPQFPYFSEFTTPAGNRLHSIIGPSDPAEYRHIFGFDAWSNMVVNPYEHFELMSYCGPKYKWVSDYTYEALYRSINERFGTKMAKGLRALPTSFFMIRGSIDTEANTASFEPFLTVPAAGALSDPAVGEFVLELLDGAGLVRLTKSFSLQFPHIEESPDLPKVGRFLFTVPADSEVREVRVRRNGVVIGFRKASAQPPKIDLRFPNGGENLSGQTADFLWESSDPEGEALSYTVLYSADGGQNWEPLALDLYGPSYTVALHRLKGTTNGLVRVIASDGFHSTTAQSASVFSVPNHPPELTLSSPGAGASFSGRQSIVFGARAVDLEDGNLSSTNVLWSSSLDGALGEGTALQRSASELSTGKHIISVVATDSAGLTNSATVEIQITRAQRPRILGLDRPVGATPHLRVRGDPYVRHAIQASSNLVDWITLSTNYSRTGLIEVDLPATTNMPQRFFRVSVPDDNAP